MVMMQGRIPAEFDAAAHTLLAGTGDPVVGVTDTGADRDVHTGVSLDTLITATTKPNTGKAYWDNGEVPDGMFVVNIWVSALSGASSTFTFALEVFTSNSFGSARTVVTSLTLTQGVHAAGFYRMLVDAKTIQLMLPNATHAAISTTKATDSPSITYVAWMGFLCA